MNKEILTQDAFGLEYFELAGDHFLVVCNGKRPTKAPPDGIGIKSGGWVIGPDEASFVLKWNKSIQNFEKIQTLPTKGAKSAAYFKIQTDSKKRHFFHTQIILFDPKSLIFIKFRYILTNFHQI